MHRARVYVSNYLKTKAEHLCVTMSMEVDAVIPETIQARFVSDTGEEAGPPLDLPTSVNLSQLGRICNAILQNVCITIATTIYCISKLILIQFFFYFLGGSIELFILY